MAIVPVQFHRGLPFVKLRVTIKGVWLDLERILLDTGSGGTVLDIDALAPLGVTPEPEDELLKIRGVGGVEYVFTRQLEALTVGPCSLPGFVAEIGSLGHGLEMQGILGMSFLKPGQARIDLGAGTLEFGHSGTHEGKHP